MPELSALQKRWGPGARLFPNGYIGVPDTSGGPILTDDPDATPYFFVPVTPDLQQDLERSNQGNKEGNFIGSVFFGAFTAAAGGAIIGASGAAGGASEGIAAGTAEGVDASTGLYAGESATAGTSTYGTVGGIETGAEVGAGAANEVTFNQAAKTIQTGLSLAKAYQSYRNSRSESEAQQGAADVSPVYSAPWKKPGDTPSAARDAIQSFNVAPLVIGALIFFLFIFLKGR